MPAQWSSLWNGTVTVTSSSTSAAVAGAAAGGGRRRGMRGRGGLLEGQVEDLSMLLGGGSGGEGASAGGTPIDGAFAGDMSLGAPLDDHDRLDDAAGRLRRRNAASVCSLALPVTRRNAHLWAADAGMVETDAPTTAALAAPSTASTTAGGGVVTAGGGGGYGGRPRAVSLTDVLSISGGPAGAAPSFASRLPDYLSGGPEANSVVVPSTLLGSHSAAGAAASIRAAVERHAPTARCDVSTAPLWLLRQGGGAHIQGGGEAEGGIYSRGAAGLSSTSFPSASAHASMTLMAQRGGGRAQSPAEAPSPIQSEDSGVGMLLLSGGGAAAAAVAAASVFGAAGSATGPRPSPTVSATSGGGGGITDQQQLQQQHRHWRGAFAPSHIAPTDDEAAVSVNAAGGSSSSGAISAKLAPPRSTAPVTDVTAAVQQQTSGSSRQHGHHLHTSPPPAAPRSESRLKERDRTASAAAAATTTSSTASPASSILSSTSTTNHGQQQQQLHPHSPLLLPAAASPAPYSSGGGGGDGRHTVYHTIPGSPVRFTLSAEDAPGAPLRLEAVEFGFVLLPRLAILAPQGTPDPLGQLGRTKVGARFLRGSGYIQALAAVAFAQPPLRQRSSKSSSREGEAGVPSSLLASQPSAASAASWKSGGAARASGAATFGAAAPAAASSRSLHAAASPSSSLFHGTGGHPDGDDNDVDALHLRGKARASALLQRRAALMSLAAIGSSPSGYDELLRAMPDFCLRVDAAARGLVLLLELNRGGARVGPSTTSLTCSVVPDAEDDVSTRAAAMTAVGLLASHPRGHKDMHTLGWAVGNCLGAPTESPYPSTRAGGGSGSGAMGMGLIAIPQLPLTGYALLDDPTAPTISSPGTADAAATPVFPPSAPLDDCDSPAAFLHAARLPARKPEWEPLLTRVGELSSRITQREARTALLRAKVDRPDLFASAGLYMHVHAMLSRYTMVLPVRRFVHALFDRVSFGDRGWEAAYEGSATLLAQQQGSGGGGSAGSGGK